MRDRVIKRWCYPIEKNDKIVSNPFKDFFQLFAVELYSGRQVERVLLRGTQKLPANIKPREAQGMVSLQAFP